MSAIIYKWVGDLPATVQRWQRKKDAPKGANLIQVEVSAFRFRFWIEMDFVKKAIKTTNGLMPVVTAYLVTPGAVMGPRDLTAADRYKWAEEWRGMLTDLIADKCNLVSHCHHNP